MAKLGRISLPAWLGEIETPRSVDDRNSGDITDIEITRIR